MNDVEKYAEELENRMVTEFKEKFYEKFEYYPIVLTKTNAVTEDSNYRAIELEELKSYFDPFLPMYNEKIVRLEMARRIKDINELRVIYCYLAKTMKYSLKEIGESIGGRDHTTVIHALNNFKNWLETDSQFQLKYTMIISYIKTKTSKLNIYEPSDLADMPEAQHQSEPALLS